MFGAPSFSGLATLLVEEVSGGGKCQSRFQACLQILRYFRKGNLRNAGKFLSFVLQACISFLRRFRQEWRISIFLLVRIEMPFALVFSTVGGVKTLTTLSKAHICSGCHSAADVRSCLAFAACLHHLSSVLRILVRISVRRRSQMENLAKKNLA